MKKYMVYCPDDNLGFIPQFFESYEEAQKFVWAANDLLPLEILGSEVDYGKSN